MGTVATLWEVLATKDDRYIDDGKFLIDSVLPSPELSGTDHVARQLAFTPRLRNAINHSTLEFAQQFERSFDVLATSVSLRNINEMQVQCCHV